ncbi:hypothetical protein [Streptomyces sp. NPDC012888]|uniref:hypothetical protein n=1 Tax=Streptomyces sp. NPDC012888 TaxID=3364855 RepID=UPI0036B13CE5
MDSEPLQIPLDQLRSAFELALQHIDAADDGSVATLDHDYFWSIPADELYDVANEPRTMTIGQVSESWQHLENLLHNPDRAVGHHLVWLADVLRAIGQGAAR